MNFGSQLHDKVKDVGSETPPVERHCSKSGTGTAVLTMSNNLLDEASELMGTVSQTKRRGSLSSQK